jgi:hypothetical protein
LRGNINVGNLVEVSTITTTQVTGWRRYPDSGIRTKLPEAVQRRVRQLVTESGWKGVKFATGFNASGDRVIHPVFQTNTEYIESLFKAAGMPLETGHGNRAKYEEALMTYFEAQIASTRSNKIGALKKAYYSK